MRLSALSVSVIRSYRRFCRCAIDSVDAFDIVVGIVSKSR